jgi:flagellin
MGMRINTNVQAQVAQRHLTNNGIDQGKSLEKLSSGSRINQAADDAAGLAISEKMRAGVASVRQNVRNANDGISMIQTAEGAMNESSNILVRMRELSIQAASDTISDNERGFIDMEVKQLSQEIDRIANSTQFNGTKLLAGEGKGLDFQIGQGNDGELDRFRYDQGRSNSTASALGIKGISVSSKKAAQSNLDKIDNAMNRLSENRSELGALQNRMQSSVRNLQIYDENLSASNSRIRDVDLAQASSELTKNNILSQAGTAVLSQANQNSNLALQLL